MRPVGRRRRSRGPDVWVPGAGTFPGLTNAQIEAFYQRIDEIRRSKTQPPEPRQPSWFEADLVARGRSPA